jgi:hypothetical protein
MKLSNNSLKRYKDKIEKHYSDNERIKREKYFYYKFKNKKINIPKILNISDNKISFKKYKFKKLNSQKIFFDALLNFLIKINNQKNYNLYSKEYLRNYDTLFKQVEKRFQRISKTKIEKKYSLKMKLIKSYINKTLRESPSSAKLLKCRKIISQSDIGFHNCGIHNNKVFFYDFEYAGLDHPIKLICDVYYQPEKKINKKYMLKFIGKLEKNLKFKIPKNFLIFEKLLKAKMILIILNIFIISNINIKSKIINKSKLNKLKSDRINKAYKYIQRPLLYE